MTQKQSCSIFKLCTSCKKKKRKKVLSTTWDEIHSLTNNFMMYLEQSNNIL